VLLRILTDYRWFLPIVTAVALGLALPSVRAGLCCDDYVVLGILSASGTMRDGYPSRLDIFNFFDGTPERTGRLLDMGLLPWWTFPGVRVAFWRPLSALTHWLDSTAWRELPALMHMQSLLWFGGLVVTTTLTYRRLMERRSAAVVAALLFAFDAAHAAAITTISGRNSILGALFGTLALLLHDRSRRTDWRAGVILAPACFALALLSSEGSVAIVGYLVAHAVFLDSGGWRRRLLALLPHAGVVAAWQVLYTGLGYGILGVAPWYLNPVREPLQFAAALAKNSPILLLAQWTGPPSQTFPTLSPEDAAVRWVGALLILIVVGAILAPLLRRDPVARFWALGQTLAVVPICAAVPHDRYLFFVGLGAMGLLAQLACGLLDQAPWRARRRWWSLSAALVACVLVVLHLVVSPIRLAQSATAPTEAWLQRASDSIPTDPIVRRQLVVIVNVTNALIVPYSFFIKTYKGQPIPAHTRVLSSGYGPVSVYREDARTVRVRWQGRQDHMFFRAKEQPMIPRERIRLTGTDIEVTALTEDGWPTEATFRFDQNLDEPELRWLRWESGSFVSFRPPAVGGTVVIR